MTARTLLIVEDNDLFRGMLCSLMTERGYTVVWSRTGSFGLTVAGRQRIDAALVDVDMPEMDGFEFCVKLRAQQSQAGQDLPVWIMTGLFRPGLAKRATEAGAMLVLRKPFPIDEVCARLEAEFSRRAEPPSAAPDGTAAKP